MINTELDDFTPNEQTHMPRWEKKFNKLLTPFDRFVNRTTTGGLILMGTALIALILANTPLADNYLHLLHATMGWNIDDWKIEKSLQHWVNDGLMALFFFVVGIELKREILVGELAEIRKAILHIVGAAMLGCIGFTMSIFIAELAFTSQPHMIVQAKLGILLSSIIAGGAGYLLLYWLGGEKSAIGASL